MYHSQLYPSLQSILLWSAFGAIANTYGLNQKELKPEQETYSDFQKHWKLKSFLPLYFANPFIFWKCLYILHFSFLALRLIIIVDEAEVWDIDSAKLLRNM